MILAATLVLSGYIAAASAYHAWISEKGREGR
jgi:hypothetical protein